MLRRGFNSLHLLQSSSWMNREGKQQVLRGSLEKATGITALSSLCGGFDLYSKKWEASTHINEMCGKGERHTLKTTSL